MVIAVIVQRVVMNNRPIQNPWSLPMASGKIQPSYAVATKVSGIQIMPKPASVHAKLATKMFCVVLILEFVQMIHISSIFPHTDNMIMKNRTQHNDTISS